MKDFTCVRLPKLTCEFMAVRNIQSIYQYFESAHGQLTSFIRLIADEGVKRFHYNFVAAVAAQSHKWLGRLICVKQMYTLWMKQGKRN